MTDRVHAYLDGEIARGALSAKELARLATLDAALVDATQTLRAAPAPDLADEVMRRLQSPPRETAESAMGTDSIRRGLAWMWRPRPLSIAFRPAYVAALGAAVLAAFLLLPDFPSPDTAPGTAAAVDSPRLYVQFRLEATGASRVELAGSFTDWQPRHPLLETAPGVWTVLVPLEPGVYDYTFVIDGDEWVVDPYAPRVADSFGGNNSRLFLPAPDAAV